MLLARRFAAVATAFLLVTGGFFVLLFSTVSFADIRIKKKQDIAGRTITSEVAIKGPRERSESEIMPGMKSITIRECDLKRNITINEAARKYLIEPMVSGADNSGRSPIDVSAASVSSRSFFNREEATVPALVGASNTRITWRRTRFSTQVQYSIVF